MQIAPNLIKKHPFRQWQTWKIPQSDWHISGYSRSGDKTGFHVPQLDIKLDASIAEGVQPMRVFMTHTHSDHSSDVEYLVSRDKMELFLPAASLKYIEPYIIARRCLNHSDEYDASRRGTYKLTGVAGGESFIWGDKEQYETHIFECVHSIPCVGYGFSEKRKRFTPEYMALRAQYQAENKMQEFGKLMAERKKTETVEIWAYEPIFAFLGDTTPAVFERNPALLAYPTIFVECTFFAPDHKEHADEKMHTHWDDLRPVIEANPQTTFVLIHFSLRYAYKDIIAFFEAQNIDNIVLWVSEEPLMQPQHEKTA